MGYVPRIKNPYIPRRGEAWGGVVVKALRYYSDGPGIDSRWCHWGFFPWYPRQNLRSTQPLKVRTRDFSLGKGGRCLWLTTYHPCSAETSRKSGTLTYPEPLGPLRPVARHLYFLHTKMHKSTPCKFEYNPV
jgi:hypothetical protein